MKEYKCKNCGSSDVHSFEFDSTRGGNARLFNSMNHNDPIDPPRYIDGYYCNNCQMVVDIFYWEGSDANYFESKLVDACRIIMHGNTYKEVIDGVEEKLLEALTIGANNTEVVKAIIRTKEMLSGLYTWELEKLKEDITEIIRLNRGEIK
jgi:hypothetical protein